MDKGQKVQIRRRAPAALWPEEMERFFDRAMKTGPWPFLAPWRLPLLWRYEQWLPEMDVFEKDGNVVVRVDLPGMKREDIDVSLEDEMLVIRGHREQEKEVKEESYHRAERSAGSFYRALSLPEGIDPDAITATYKDGVLAVTVPQPPARQANKLKVEVK